jgi:hypothetical protein
VSCRYHLISDIGEKYTGNRFVERKSCGPVALLESPDRIVEILEDMPQTCALDMADQGGLSLEEVSDALGVSRQRVSQLETAGKKSLKAALKVLGGFR